MRMLWFFVLLSGILVVPKVESKKEVNVALFLDDDDQYELTTIAVASAMRRINLYKMPDYLLRPHIFRTNKTNVLEVGDIVCNLMEKGVAAIFGPESPEINGIIQSVSATLQIPQFQTFWNPKLSSYYDTTVQNGAAPVLNVYPSPKMLSKALATLITTNAWEKFMVIYEDDDGFLRMQEALKHRRARENAVLFRRLGANENHRSVLKEIKKTGLKYFILDCEADHVFDILREAKEHELLSEFHSYILTNLDVSTLDWSSFKGVESNITYFRLINTTAHITTTVLEWNMLLNYPLEGIEHTSIQQELDRIKTLRQIQIKPTEVRVKTALLYDALNMFMTAFAEIDAEGKFYVTPVNCDQTYPSWHGRRIFDAIKERKFESGVLLKPLTGPIKKFSESGQRLNCELEVIEHLNENRSLATWNSDEPEKMQFKISSERWDESTKRVIRAKNFRVVSRLEPPHFMYKPDHHKLKGNDRFEGYAIDLMAEICSPQKLGCNFTFYVVPDGKNGNFDHKTKKWNGLIGELLDLKADLAVGDLTITYDRRKVVDFTMPFMTLGISILYARAMKEPPDLLSFSHPLLLEVWLYTATAYLIISIIIFLVARLNPNDWENPHPCDPHPTELENIWNIKNCLWLTLGSIMAQGCDILPKGISTRMVASMWWFFSLIMTACYTANLAAFLTMERMGPTIESAEDLAAQTKIKYGCVKNGATAAFFRDTNFTTYHRMWLQMETAEPTVFMDNNADGVKRVLNSKRQYAFLMESSSIEYEMEKNCELIKVGNNLDSKGYGIAMPTNAWYRKAINEEVLKLQEMGFLLELKDKWWIKKTQKVDCKEDKHSSDDTATELGLDHVGGVFVVLAAGVCLSLVIAVCEFLWSVRKVAVVEHLSPQEAFYKELKFAMNIWARKKAVHSTSRSRSREKSSEESLS